MLTEKLRIPYRFRLKKDRWIVDNETGFYHTLLKHWWDYFGLAGSGLVVGEEGEYGVNVKIRLIEDYPEIGEVFTVGLKDSDINCDIQVEIPVPKKVNWVICQAVLEHLADPFGAMCNMFNTLEVEGRGFFHTVGPGFGYHGRPVDCCRFFRDVFFEWERLAGNVVMEDLMWTRKHCFAVYRKL